MDNDTVGVANRTVDEIETWAPGLPVFGQLTPFPATPLYDRLAKAGRLQRPKHWLDFAPFVMAHDPLKMTHRGREKGDLRRVVAVLQPETQPRSDRRDRRFADRRPDQPPRRSAVFPRNLFPANGHDGVDKTARVESVVDIQPCTPRFLDMAEIQTSNACRSAGTFGHTIANYR